MKGIIISTIIAVSIVGAVAFFGPSNSQDDNLTTVDSENNVVVVNGLQIVELQAKGGYQPRKSIAKAGIPTIIRLKTSGTFDCSSSVRIPSLSISKFLPQTGSTDIEIGIQPVGVFRGSCGMGMYPFEIDFQS